jgi:hypothetical protein
LTSRRPRSDREHGGLTHQQVATKFPTEGSATANERARDDDVTTTTTLTILGDRSPRFV